MPRDFSAGARLLGGKSREFVRRFVNVRALPWVSPILPHDKYRGYEATGNSRNLRSHVDPNTFSLSFYLSIFLSVSLFPLPNGFTLHSRRCCCSTILPRVFSSSLPSNLSLSRSFISSALPLLAFTVIVVEKYSGRRCRLINGKVDVKKFTCLYVLFSDRMHRVWWTPWLINWLRGKYRGLGTITKWKSLHTK